jgi:hypothetical protein
VIDESEETSLPTTRRRSVNTDIQSIRRSLTSIARALRRLGPALAALARGAQGSRPARKLKLSAERMAALELQGQYIGHIRTLDPRQKDRVRAVRARKGVRAAIRYAKKLRKKP